MGTLRIKPDPRKETLEPSERQRKRSPASCPPSPPLPCSLGACQLVTHTQRGSSRRRQPAKQQRQPAAAAPPRAGARGPDPPQGDQLQSLSVGLEDIQNLGQNVPMRVLTLIPSDTCTWKRTKDKSTHSSCNVTPIRHKLHRCVLSFHDPPGRGPRVHWRRLLPCNFRKGKQPTGPRVHHPSTFRQQPPVKLSPWGKLGTAVASGSRGLVPAAPSEAGRLGVSHPHALSWSSKIAISGGHPSRGRCLSRY